MRDSFSGDKLRRQTRPGEPRRAGASQYVIAMWGPLKAEPSVAHDSWNRPTEVVCSTGDLFQISNSAGGILGRRKSCSRLSLAGVLRILLVSSPLVHLSHCFKIAILRRDCIVCCASQLAAAFHCCPHWSATSKLLRRQKLLDLHPCATAANDIVVNSQTDGS
jgi:hypothetical protein